mmetsp:Transcript_62956/g.73266  ORF Transcript_62956/g.73266 Transcript_62956/m.73266 type:complete len:267 (+) Transcript_62956:1344-2144(+)
MGGTQSQSEIQQTNCNNGTYRQPEMQLSQSKVDSAKLVLLQQKDLYFADNVEKQKKQAEQARKQAEFERQQQDIVQKREQAKLLAQKCRDSLCVYADEYIRSRRQFNHEKPLLYQCQINSFQQEYFQEITELNAISPSCVQDIKQILMSDPLKRFVVGRNTFSVAHLTPFQGSPSHRIFGEFRCRCGKSWRSAGTYTDTWQKCKSCERKIYPFKQHILLAHADSDDEDEAIEKRPHDVARCGKCQELGRLCMPHRYYDQTLSSHFL